MFIFCFNVELSCMRSFSKAVREAVAGNGRQRMRKHMDRHHTSHYYRLQSFNYVNHELMWIMLKEIGMSEHLVCLIRSLHTKEEVTVRTEYGETEWFGIGERDQTWVHSLPLVVQSS